MKVIFLKDVGGVGKRNDIKEVADGYALNFLIPHGHAVHASADRIKAVQAQVALAKRVVEDRNKHIIQGIDRLRGGNVRINAKANPVGGLYREITTDMIVTAISSAFGVHVPQAAIQITEPIKKVGQHTVHIVHDGKSQEFRITVAKNG